VTLVIGMALIATGCVGGGSGDLPSIGSEPGSGTRGVVTWIDDGDTIEVDLAGEVSEVRLVAVNAPDQGECYAGTSLDYLIETLRDRPVRLQVMGVDQFGRTLAHVFEGDRHINVELVEKGLVFASTPEEDDPYSGVLLEAEGRAYDESVGLWADDACGSEHQLPNTVIDPDLSDVDPEGPDESRLADESIAILNPGRGTIDLTGWILRDESTRNRFTFPPVTTLGPGERVIVASSDTGWSPGGGPVWNNSGDMALLQLPDGTVVSRWRY